MTRKVTKWFFFQVWKVPTFFISVFRKTKKLELSSTSEESFFILESRSTEAAAAAAAAVKHFSWKRRFVSAKFFFFVWFAGRGWPIPALCVCVYVCVDVWVCASMCVWVSVCVCLCVGVCVCCACDVGASFPCWYKKTVSRALIWTKHAQHRTFYPKWKLP